MKNTAINLFCGAGGCSLGFEQSGYQVLLATDIDRAAGQTYLANFKGTQFLKEDINNLDFSSMLSMCEIAPGELDILLGGPPCQGFSSAGLRFWDDPRNSLLKSYAKALKTISPKWFLMENVEGLLTTKNGEYLHEAVKMFISLGYAIRVEKVYAHEYGVPQRRKRVLVVGNRIGIDFKFPKPTTILTGRIFRNSDVTLRHAIGTLPDASSDPSAKIEYQTEVSDEFEDYLRGASRKISDHFYPQQGVLQMERILRLKPGQTMKHLPEHLQHKSFKKRANRRVMDGIPTEKRGGSPCGLKRLIYDEPCLTITGTAIREFIHPSRHRPLTIRECARIQTFPDDFKFIGRTSEKMQQIGNAVPPLMARIFAEHIRDEYGFSGQPTTKGRLISYSVTKADATSPALKKTCLLLNKEMNTFSQGVLGL